MEKSFEMAIAAECGAGKLSGDGGAEYPCVSRLRHRRLYTFLWLQGFKATAEAMLDESDAFLSVPRLQELVERDQWCDAIRYLSRFLPPPTDTERRPPLSVEAEVLHRFLGVHMALACIVAGENGFYSKYISHDGTVCHGAIRLRSIILSIVYARHQVRDSIDWECVRRKASFIVQDLAYKTPELTDFIYMEASQMMPHHVLPIGFRFRRRSCSKKQIRRPGAYAVAKVYLERQRSLPVFAVPSQESCDELSVSKALDWVADIVDECLKAGKRTGLPLQTSAEGATAALVSQTMFGSLTRPAFPGIPSVAASEGSKFTSHVPTNSAAFLGTMYAPVSQTGFGSLRSCCGNSGAGLMANAGATAASVSWTMFGSLAHPARNPGMLSVANAVPDAGKLGSHVPTPGAPFLGNMRPPVSQNVFGSLASCYRNSSVGLMANAGAPISPVSQTMNLTSHARDSGALVAPVSQNMYGTLTGPAPTAGMPLVANAGHSAGLPLAPGAPYLGTMLNAPVSLTAVGCSTGISKDSGLSPMTNNSGAPVSLAKKMITNLANHAENYGAPVAPAVQTTNLGTCAENSGINKGLASSAGSAHKILDASKNRREELSILDEQKQQTTGAFGEASLTPAIET